MTRVKRGVATRKRHKKILKATKGYRGQNSSLFRLAKQAWMKAGLHAYKGRKLKKREYRQLWIARITAALKAIDPKNLYSRFVNNAASKNVQVNRKVLADLAVNHPKAFEAVVKEVGAQ